MEYYGCKPKRYRSHLLINHDLFEVRIISTSVSELSNRQDIISGHQRSKSIRNTHVEIQITMQ
jgi:hypothetical protein